MITAYLDAPRLTCATCGSMMLINRPRDGFSIVSCLNKDCAQIGRRFRYQLQQVQLLPESEPLAHDPYRDS